MRTYYASAPSPKASVMMSWQARPWLRMRAERAREHARIRIWEYEGGSLFHPRNGYERYRTDGAAAPA